MQIRSLIAMLTLTLAGPTALTHAASILRIGPCVNPHCNVTPPNAGFVDVATGNYHTMGLRSNGSIDAWGMCDVSQCNVPPPNTQFVAISSGDSHSIALRSNGSLVGWGSNENGELDGFPSPNTGFVAIASGLLHNLALKADGSIVGFGRNVWGEATPPAPNTNWTAIAAGGFVSMGLKSDGSIRKWGCNGPCALPSPNTGFVAISTNVDYSLAVRADGSIEAWGSNTHGQLDVPSPNTGFVSVAAGDHFALGLRSDGSLVAWGTFDEDDVPVPNTGYLKVTANKGLADALKGEGTDSLFTEAPPISTSGVNTSGAVAADVDGDGDQDIVAAEYGADRVAFYENSGTAPPVWTKHSIDNQALGPVTVAVADFDGDLDADVISANFNDEGVRWYENNGAAPPSWTKRFVSGASGAWAVHAADLDDDGDMDGVGGVRVDAFDHRGVEWYENVGGSPTSFVVRRVSAGFVDAASVHAADLDADGDGDVLAVDVFADRVFWFENEGGSPPAWTQRTLTAATDEPWSVFAADLDRDGDQDVLSASGQDDTVAWYENDGAASPGWIRHVLTTAAPQPTAVFAADLDGDADPDVVSGAWGNEIAWYESDGGLPPAFTRRVISHDCSGPEAVFAARLDPDADLDILAACQILGRLHWYPNQANFAESDGDGVRDDLDCAPADTTAFALPAEVHNLHYESASVLAWASPVPPSGTGTVHDVLRGSLAGFPVGSDPNEACAAPATASSALTDPFVPPPGTGVYYLVRAQNACGAGSYGFDSEQNERESDACP